MIRYIIILCSLILACQAACPAQPVLDIGSRRELFVDDYVIAELNDLSLRLHHPQPASLSSAPLEPGPFSTVIYDKTNGTYHYYYRKPCKNPEGNKHFQVAYYYMVSDDGIHWRKPDLNLFPEYGPDHKNMILKPEDPISHNFSPFLDIRPGVPPNERFKAVAGATKTWSAVGDGLYGLVSSDGIHWQMLQEEPIFRTAIAGEHPEYDNYFDSQNVAFWSEAEGCYVLYYRVTWMPNPRGWVQSLRGIGRATSSDFTHWKQGVELPVNLPNEQFYTNQTSPYFRAPHIYIALPWRYLPPKPGNIHFHASDVVLMTARGPKGYDRTFIGAFMRPSLASENWNQANPAGVFTTLNIVPTGDTEMSIYASGRRYTLRMDGFASVHASGMNYGWMITKPLIFAGETLEINYSTSAAGRILIEIQDQQGNPIPGYTLDDCDVIIGDEISGIVQWGGRSDVSQLAGRPIHLLVKMRDADLYSFRFRGSGELP